jgi:hypothetical protein
MGWLVAAKAYGAGEIRQFQLEEGSGRIDAGGC